MRHAKTCPKCRQRRFLERHHVMPVRYYGRKGNRLIFCLCANCHREVEIIITKAEKKNGQLADQRYVQIMFTFLEDV